MISAIVVSYQAIDVLKQCLDKLIAALGAWDHQIIVVDNSTDESALRLGRLYPDIDWIVNQANVGFAVASNQGAANARGEWLLFVNPDLMINEHAIRFMLETANEHPECGCFGPRIESPTGRIEKTCNRHLPGLRAAWRSLFGLGARSMYRRDSGPVPCLSGACFLVKRVTFEEVSGFDPSLPLYLDDMDLFWRLGQQGEPLQFVNEAVVQHVGGASVSQLPNPRMTSLMRVIAFDRAFAKRRQAVRRFVHRASLGLFACFAVLLEVLALFPATCFGRTKWVLNWLRLHASMLCLCATGRFASRQLPANWPRHFLG
ncbi:MAG: glycosyltransferase family 2 protein [Acidobacteria bacterium]|nr:glycosyltransferase family 2 protein [Acidobacteriota bacterium]